MKELLIEIINEINAYSNIENETINQLLNQLLIDAVNFNSTILKIKPIHPIKKFSVLPLEESFGVNIGVKRSEDTITTAQWLFRSKKATRSNNYLLYFIIIKESLLHFLPGSIREIDEAIVNIITILWLKEFFDISTIDNPLYKAINHRIYSNNIANIHYTLFDSLANILFIKNLPFQEVFLTYLNSIKNDALLEFEIFKNFSNWVNSFVIDYDVIVPIYLKKTYLSIIDLLIKIGCDNGNAETIAKKLNSHPNTIRGYFRAILENYSIFWRAVINLEKIKLHNYLLKISFENEDFFEKILDMVSNIPYNKSIYTGITKDSRLIYCPSLICPHMVSEQLNVNLAKLQRNGEILDYNLQQIYERIHYGTITTKALNPSIEFFSDVLEEKKKNEFIYKYVFAHEKEDFCPIIEDTTKALDYNLLYFLSILKSKYLLKQGYNVYTSELPKLFEKNNIALSDSATKSDFLNQIEIRARNRGILSYAYFMSSFSPRNSEVLIVEIPTLNKDYNKKLDEIMLKLRMFSFLGNIIISDRVLVTLPGISHNHPVSKLIKNKLDKNNIENICYTINSYKLRVIPLYDLYNYEQKKWVTDF